MERRIRPHVPAMAKMTATVSVMSEAERRDRWGDSRTG